MLASGQTQKRLATCSSFHGRVEAPSEVPQLVPGFSDFPCGARSAVCSVSLGVHMRSPFCRGARPSLSRGERGPGRPPPRVRFQTWALGFPRIVIREPRCLGEQHFSCTGASMGSCGGSFVGRWHRESGTSPTWPQMGPAPVPTPSQVPVGLARAPRTSGPSSADPCNGRYGLSLHLRGVRKDLWDRSPRSFPRPAVPHGPGQASRLTRCPGL